MLEFEIIYDNQTVKVLKIDKGKFYIYMQNGQRRRLTNWGIYPYNPINRWSFKRFLEDEDDEALAEVLGKLIEQREKRNQ